MQSEVLGVVAGEASHFLPALAADLVVFPATSFLSTDLMTPTATVCLMSRTAKRPEKESILLDTCHLFLYCFTSVMICLSIGVPLSLIKGEVLKFINQYQSVFREKI